MMVIPSRRYLENLMEIAAESKKYWPYVYGDDGEFIYQLTTRNITGILNKKQNKKYAISLAEDENCHRLYLTLLWTIQTLAAKYHRWRDKIVISLPQNFLRLIVDENTEHFTEHCPRHHHLRHEFPYNIACTIIHSLTNTYLSYEYKKLTL